MFAGRTGLHCHNSLHFHFHIEYFVVDRNYCSFVEDIVAVGRSQRHIVAADCSIETRRIVVGHTGAARTAAGRIVAVAAVNYSVDMPLYYYSLSRLTDAF